MDVGLGEAAIGITFSHDGLKPSFEGYPVALSFPKDGTGFEIGCIGLIKGAPEKEKANAIRFIDWIPEQARPGAFRGLALVQAPREQTGQTAQGLCRHRQPQGHRL